MDRVRLFVGIAMLALAMAACGIMASDHPWIVSTSSPVLTGTASSSSATLPIATHTPRPTPTASATPTPPSLVPGVQPGRETKTAAPVPIHTGTPTPSSTVSATPVPPSPTPTETVTPTLVGPTPAPSPEEVDKAGQITYRYHPLGPAQPELSQPCPGCPRAPGYIVGRVVDAGGNPLAGVRLVCYNDWHRYPVVGSKGGGEYDFPILQAEATWYVVILNEADQPVSPEAPVHFNPLEACWYRLDWQRID
jgi:hypothetical protein